LVVSSHSGTVVLETKTIGLIKDSVQCLGASRILHPDLKRRLGVITQIC